MPSTNRQNLQTYKTKTSAHVQKTSDPVGKSFECVKTFEPVRRTFAPTPLTIHCDKATNRQPDYNKATLAARNGSGVSQMVPEDPKMVPGGRNMVQTAPKMTSPWSLLSIMQDHSRKYRGRRHEASAVEIRRAVRLRTAQRRVGCRCKSTPL